MKQILLFGAGMSSSALIKYIIRNAEKESWHLHLVDANKEAALSKTGHSPHATVHVLDITKGGERHTLVQQADIIVSLLPPQLHLLIAEDCLQFGKNLLTASYVNPELKERSAEIKDKGLLFLCEMGLDPGIDHMSAKKLIDEIKAEGGKIISFKSHCGGLVSPQSDNNPWHYKISWNPRNVVMAGKAGAFYKQNGEFIELRYTDLFSERRYVQIMDGDNLCYYPNRDSLSYIEKYNLEEAQTFLRTTLRHPDFIYGWKNLLELKLTEETPLYNTDGLTLKQFFKKHLEENGFSEWLETRLKNQFDSTKNLLNELVNLTGLEQKAEEKGLKKVDEFMVVNDQGDLEKVDIDDLKITAASTLASQIHDASLTLKQLFFLGMDDDNLIINKGTCSPADVLQHILQTKMILLPGEQDRVIMQHEIIYEKDEKKYQVISTLILDGEEVGDTAMSKTVGLPLAIALKLILNNTIQEKGLLVPLPSSIYEPVLKELQKEGISFREEVSLIS